MAHALCKSSEGSLELVPFAQTLIYALALLLNMTVGI